LGPDHYLFFSRKRVNKKSLPLKWEWLEHVTTARAAATADVSAKDTYNHERTGMREWILRHNPASLLIRDGPKKKPNKKIKKLRKSLQKNQRQDLQRQELQLHKNENLPRRATPPDPLNDAESEGSVNGNYGKSPQCAYGAVGSRVRVPIRRRGGAASRRRGGAGSSPHTG
jgi:hypothetical protein